MGLSHEGCVNDKNGTQRMGYTVKACSHGAIATALVLSQQIGCMRFIVSVHMLRLQQQN